METFFCTQLNLNFVDGNPIKSKQKKYTLSFCVSPSLHDWALAGGLVGELVVGSTGLCSGLCSGKKSSKFKNQHKVDL